MNLKKRVGSALILLCGLLLLSCCPVFANEEDASDRNVSNILLIGSDQREDESWNGNSDVVVLLTINNSTQKVILTSFMRDLYADIPGYGGNKLNYAYAVGGASLLVETLEDNYDLNIDNYAAVDFDSMAEIIDLVGGVDMEISDEEASVLNDYLSSMGQWEEELYGGGVCHLDGYQAVAFMRIRYVGDDDYERTERQRRVLTEVFVSLEEKNAAEMTILAEQVLALTDNDLSPLDLVSLLASVTNVMDYSVVESRVPFDGLYSTQDEMLVPDFSATKELLYETLYE